MPKLVDMSIDEVSLVDKAANLKRFLVVKRAAEGGDNMNILEEIAELQKAGKKISGANLDKLKGLHQQLGSFIDNANGADDDDGGAGGDVGIGDNNVGVNKSMDEVTLQKKLDAIEKAYEEKLTALTKRAEDAENIAKAERDSRVLKEYIAKAADLASLPIEAAEFGGVLKALAEKAPDEFAKLMPVLTSANEIAKKGALFAEYGTRSTQSSDITKRMDVEVDKVCKAEPNLTKEQAVRKVLKANPELYRQYVAELKGQ